MKKFKYLIILFFINLMSISTYACDACQKQQPKILKGISHGAGPESKWDWVVIITIFAITIVTLWMSLKYIIKPGEKGQDHIKRTILN